MDLQEYKKMLRVKKGYLEKVLQRGGNSGVMEYMRGQKTAYERILELTNEVSTIANTMKVDIGKFNMYLIDLNDVVDPKEVEEEIEELIDDRYSCLCSVKLVDSTEVDWHDGININQNDLFTQDNIEEYFTIKEE